MIFCDGLQDLDFGVENDVDMIFASFIRKKEDVQDVRAHLGDRGKHIRIVSKVMTMPSATPLSLPVAD